jgi:hypothetical protein
MISSFLLFEHGDIDRVLGATGGLFVFEEVVQTDHGDLDPINRNNRSIAPCGFEIQARNLRDEIDSKRGNAYLKCVPNFGKVVGCNFSDRCAKMGECQVKPARVFDVGTYPEVNVPRVSWATVNGHGVRADKQEFNICTSKFDQHVSEVLFHREVFQ